MSGYFHLWLQDFLFSTLYILIVGMHMPELFSALGDHYHLPWCDRSFILLNQGMSIIVKDQCGGDEQSLNTRITPPSPAIPGQLQVIS